MTPNPTLNGTDLEGLTIDDLVRNLEDNRRWERRSVEEASVNLRSKWDDYVFALESDLTYSVIAKRINVAPGDVRRWKEEKEVHHLLKAYKKSYLPDTPEEARAFCHLLGIYAKLYGKSQRSALRLARVMDTELGREAFQNAVTIVTENEAKVRGNSVIAQDKNLVQTIKDCITYRLEEYIRDEETAISFLQGFFDTTHDIGKTVDHYTITSSDPVAFNAVLTALHVLRIYPTLRSDERFELKSKEELQAFHDNHIDRNETRRKRIDRRLTDGIESFKIGEYYKARERIVELRGQGIGWDTIGKELAMSSNKARKWVADILPVGSVTFGQPKRVKRFEGVIEFLGIQNEYTKEYYVRFGEQRQSVTFEKERVEVLDEGIAFLVESKVYQLDKDVIVQGVKAELILSELEKEVNLEYEDRKLKIELDGRKITYVGEIGEETKKDGLDPSEIETQVFTTIDGVEYRIQARALKEYLAICKRRTLQEDDLDYLATQLILSFEDLKERAFDVTLGDDLTITDIQQHRPTRKYKHKEFLEVRVQGKRWVFANVAIAQYFSKFGVPQEPLDSADVEYLQEELAKNLDGSADRDINLKYHGNVVVSLGVREAAIDY